MSGQAARRYCGREFSPAELDHIRQLLELRPALGRVALSRRICQDLAWLNVLGQPKEMSCRVAMLRMEKDGLIGLPPPLTRTGGGPRRLALSAASDPREPVQASVRALEPLIFERVQKGSLSSLWNELIQRYHYLGYRPLSGAQMRYLVWSADHRLLAALGFGASAWQLQPRDQHIGWTDPQRVRGLHRIVNNARFLILPWVKCSGLASRILSAMAQPLRADWTWRYGYEPVLLESFVEVPHFFATSYHAANWIRLGETRGRGKLEKNNQQVLRLRRSGFIRCTRTFVKFSVPPPDPPDAPPRGLPNVPNVYVRTCGRRYVDQLISAAQMVKDLRAISSDCKPGTKPRFDRSLG